MDISASAGELRAGKPALFVAPVDQRKTLRNNYAVSRDGQRFLVLALTDRSPSPLVTVLTRQKWMRR